MHGRVYLAVMFCIAILLIGHTPLAAQWVENGTPVYIEGNPQLTPVIAPDGMGGAIIAWQCLRTGTNYDVYAQRLNVSGVPMWGADGIAICTDGMHQEEIRICPDGFGGAVITWVDNRSSIDEDIYAQRVNANGSIMWNINGIPVCIATNNQDGVQIISDGTGGAIIVWHDWRNGERDIYAQRLDAGGFPVWEWNGSSVCTYPGNNQEWPQLVTDGANGAIITWADNRGTALDIYAQRIESDGSASWTANGIAVSTAASIQGDPQIAADGAGGAIITWQDFRNGDYDIYAQRVNSSGAVQWTPDGVALCTAMNTQFDPFVVSDGLGGGIVAWLDYRNAVTIDVYVRRVDAAGTPLWAADGIALTNGPDARNDARIVEDGAGGAIISWQINNIYVQRITGSGTVLWTANGEPVVIAPGVQDNPVICSNGYNGAIIAYEDYRSTDADVYAAHIEHDGRLYYPSPDIYEVRDVPGDEGGYVYLSWWASREDYWMGDLLTHYTIWRAIDPDPALLMIESGEALLVANSGDIPETPGPVIRRQMLGMEVYFWELVDTQDAYYQETYGKTIGTLFDSTAVSTEYHYFQIVAHTSDPTVYWESEPDSGYSVDNLAPCPPAMLAGEQSFVPEGLMLKWDQNTEPDIDGYAIYRDVGPGFTPGPGNRLTEPCDTFYFDGDWRWDSGYCYKVAAVDVHGNESACAVLCSDGITGGETPAAPSASFLAQNHPNPFNPMTTISFGLAEPAHVTLRIYDAAGRLVLVLIDGHRPAGRYEVTWDGRAGAGRTAASGVYFYRLNAGAFEKTRKMVLLK